MGAWSENIFGNDTACDWIAAFLDEPGVPTLRQAIDAVLSATDYLESDAASECLAACEVIARLQGRAGLKDSYTKELDEWIEKNPTHVPEDLKAAADAAIGRILAPNSELPELWDEDGRNDVWHDLIDDLRERVKAGPLR